MKQYFHLTLQSGNDKTGPIPVSTTSNDSCPSTCEQFKACYAKQGKLSMHWKKVSSGDRGTTLTPFTRLIAALPAGTLWRHNQAGDLPGVDGIISLRALKAIVKANSGKRGFTYTHKPMNARNAAAVKMANDNGFTVNVSADGLCDADAKKALGIGPVVTVLTATQNTNLRTPAGNLVVICPATQREDVKCSTCKLCAWVDRDVIIGFPAHGPAKKYIQIGGAK